MGDLILILSSNPYLLNSIFIFTKFYCATDDGISEQVNDSIEFIPLIEVYAQDITLIFIIAILITCCDIPFNQINADIDGGKWCFIDINLFSYLIPAHWWLFI